MYSNAIYLIKDTNVHLMYVHTFSRVIDCSLVKIKRECFSPLLCIDLTKGRKSQAKTAEQKSPERLGDNKSVFRDWNL